MEKSPSKATVGRTVRSGTHSKRGAAIASGVRAPNASGSARRLLTAAEVAELLGVPCSWVYEQSRLGRIPTVSLGRYRRYRREAIEAWVVAMEAPARGARAFTPRGG